MVTRFYLAIFILLIFFSCQNKKSQNEKEVLVVLDQYSIEGFPYGKMYVRSILQPISDALPFPKHITPYKYFKIQIGTNDLVDVLFGKTSERDIMLFDVNRNNSFIDDQVLEKRNNYPVKVQLLNPGSKDSFRIIEKVKMELTYEGVKKDKDINFVVHQPYRYGVANIEGEKYKFGYFNFSINIADPIIDKIRSLIIVKDSAMFPSFNEGPVKYKVGDTIYFGKHIYKFSKSNKSGDSLYLTYLSTTTQPYGIEVDQLAVPVEATNILTNKIANYKLTGKYTLIDFWGTWCGPCLELTPRLKITNELYNRNNLQIISVAYDDNINEVIEYAKEHEMDWINLFDQKSSKQNSLIEKYRVTNFPTLVLIDKSGKIVAREIGVNGYKVIENHLKKLIPH